MPSAAIASTSSSAAAGSTSATNTRPAGPSTSGWLTIRRTPSRSHSAALRCGARSASTDERSLSTAPSSLPLRRLGDRPFGPLGQLVDDDDREGEDRQRPERIGRDREQRTHRVEGGDEDAEPAPELATGEEREGGDQLEHAEDQRDPAPGVQAADDVGGVGGEELRVADRRDAVDDVEDPGDDQQHADEDPPAIESRFCVHAQPFPSVENRGWDSLSLAQDVTKEPRLGDEL